LFDEEAERFGKQLLEVLKDSGFNSKEARGPFGFGIPGEWILVRDLRKYQTGPSLVGELQEALIIKVDITLTTNKWILQ